MKTKNIAKGDSIVSKKHWGVALEERCERKAVKRYNSKYPHKTVNKIHIIKSYLCI